MKRGLAFEYPMGPIYQESATARLHKGLNKILGYKENYFTKGNFDTALNEALFRLADEDFLPTLAESAELHLRQFKIRTGDLMNSFGFAIYLNGKYQSEYVRTVKEHWEPETDERPRKHRMSPQYALRDFARQYDCISRNGFTVVFMVGYPYSVDLETGESEFTNRKIAVLYYMGRHFVEQLAKAKPKGVHYTPVYQVIMGNE